MHEKGVTFGAIASMGCTPIRFPRRSAPSIHFPKCNSQDRRPQFIQLSPMDLGEPYAACGESFFAYQAAACGVANCEMES